MCYSLVPFLNHYYVCACELRFKEDSKRKSNHVTFSCDAEDKVTVTEIFKMLFFCPSAYGTFCGVQIRLPASLHIVSV